MRVNFFTILVTFIFLQKAAAAAQENDDAPWSASPAVVEAASQRNREANFVEANVPPYTLPDPFIASDGTRVTRETWPARRAEILELFKEHVYGRAPIERPENISFKTLEEDARDLDGQATRRLVEISFDTPHAGRFRFPVQLYLPNRGARPLPAVVLLQFEGLTDRLTPLIIDRGYALAIVDRRALAADDKATFRDGIINAFSGEEPLAGDAWRAIAAWAWGASRVMDYLETEPAIDSKQIGVAGHSRMGKTALWAAANDERFAITLSNQSGCGGAALSRRVFGETVERINTVFPHWFCENFQRYNGRESELPVDQHMLLALIAPRRVYVTSADEDLWADPRGEFLSCFHADPVYRLLGVPGLGETPLPFKEGQGDGSPQMPPLGQPIHGGHIGYHVRPGAHAFTEYDWKRFLDFASADPQSR
ncbi:MAG TPA: acetylxylan esterase [Lacipirellulaceae bacterium]